MPELKAIEGNGYQSKDIGADWGKKTATRLKMWQFDGAGAWSNPAIHKYVPYGIVLGLATSYPNIADPQWEHEIEPLIQKSVQPTDINLVGYWLDNEIDWAKLYPLAEKYFDVTSRLVRKYDPNHLILGVRFNHSPPDSVLIASRGKVDAHSFNIYSDNPEDWDKEFKRAFDLAGVPSQISEFSFYSDENTSGDLNTRGWGGRVATQTERTAKIKKTLIAWINNPLVVGANFFQWCDEPPGGRFDEEDCNYGLVDIYDKPYSVVGIPSILVAKDVPSHK